MSFKLVAMRPSDSDFEQTLDTHRMVVSQSDDVTISRDARLVAPESPLVESPSSASLVVVRLPDSREAIFRAFGRLKIGQTRRRREKQVKLGDISTARALPTRARLLLLPLLLSKVSFPNIGQTLMPLFMATTSTSTQTSTCTLATSSVLPLSSVLFLLAASDLNGSEAKGTTLRKQDERKAEVDSSSSSSSGMNEELSSSSLNFSISTVANYLSLSSFKSDNKVEQSEELIELLAELYAHIIERQDLVYQYIQLIREFDGKQNNATTTQIEEDKQVANKLEVKKFPNLEQVKMLFSADEESLSKWVKMKQLKYDSLKNKTFELLSEYPNRTINVCLDGPKILVLPNVSDILYCYTREQWIEKLWLDLRLSSFHYPIIVLNILIFLFGTTGNIFVCLSVYRNHQLRNVTNYFIVNLAAADFLVILICLPATVVWDLSLTWFFGTIPCKLIIFLQDVSISVSVLTLTAISIDRYYAICYPLKFKSSLSQAKRAIILIWIISLLTMTPDLIYLSANESAELKEAGLDTVLYSDCNYQWSNRSSKIFQFVKTILLYLIPLLLMFWAHFKIMQTLKVATITTNQTLRSMQESMVLKQQAALFVATKTTINNQQQQTINDNLTCGIGNNNQSTALRRDPIVTATSLPTETIPSSLIEIRSSLAEGQTTSSLDDIRSREIMNHHHETNQQQQTSTRIKQAVRFVNPIVTAQINNHFSKQEARNRRALDEGGQNRSFPSHSKENLTNKEEKKFLGKQIEGTQQQQQQQQTKAPTRETETETSQTCHLTAPSTYRNSSCIDSSSSQFMVTMHNKRRLESRRLAAKMLSAIVILFGICYLPVHLINFLRQFIEDIPQNDVTSTISMLSHCVCYLNSAINPIIYNHMNSVFRAEFKKFLACFCWNKSSGSSTNTSLSNQNNNKLSANGTNEQSRTVSDRRESYWQLLPTNSRLRQKNVHSIKDGTSSTNSVNFRLDDDLQATSVIDMEV